MGLFLLTGPLGLALLWGWRRVQEAREVESGPLAFFGVIALVWIPLVAVIAVA